MTTTQKPSATTTEADAPEPHDLGLSHDLPTLLNRRRALGLISATGLAAALAACTGGGGTGSTTSAGTPDGGPGGTPPDGGPSGSGGGEVSQADVGEGEIPEETNGPYPADGTNGVNILTETGVVRSDITTSFGESSGTAEGIPLTVTFTVVDVSGEGDAGTPVVGAAVYAWHCDRDGKYSMYDLEDQNYLRGVQETDAAGKVTFTSIFPGCYAGRWPHIHFEIYPSLDDATSATNRQRTSQLAFPEDACGEVYATEGYEQSVTNLAGITLDTDNVFSDGYSLQMARCSGSVADGYTATLTVPI
ncbi:intradiol ring-cleavage dioxygenase [Myceligenerans pegani]|uniref:Intradiol ring-cleavage dioxygenase n=1 Tax=Myceligenerans pegani TaxID=2776917 RepID=A0ABR9MYT1_9MICO|nr:intradiol ring-cleavage dioxygenase [Myceligenerans sp. TRM 65318]MBE1876171.1 intradiol ring-cleavage dioxygenase [Myceligenerans sp. TRM 65318]MBE3018442.1 intradiol ring-cleavage dioxygenase [Myceligenerans sp. TRM 65318]